MNASSCLALLLVAGGLLIGTVCQSQAADHLVGGYSEASVTNTEVVAAAQFAVNAQALSVQRGPAISVVEILSAQQQVVAGMNYRLRMKVKVDGKDRDVEAVVWWQAWRKPDPYQLTSWAWVTPPDEAILSRLRKGMLFMQFEQVVGKSAKPRPNPTPHDSVADNSPVAPAATVRDYRVVRDGLTVTQREAERAKNWSAWVEAHPRNTNEAEFVYTVGTDTNGVPIQQVEWLYDSPELKRQVCAIFAWTVVEVVRVVDGKAEVKCKKGTPTLPIANKLTRQDTLATDAPLGWMDKNRLVRVRLSALESHGGGRTGDAGQEAVTEKAE
jgi:hypothetical protein